MNHANRYVAQWLKNARRALAKDPSNDLENYTTVTFMFGAAWDFSINYIYAYPSSLEDWRQRGRVHQILRIAFRNIIERAERLPPQKWDATNCRDVCEAYRLAMMMSQTDLVSVAQMKIRLNKLCARFGITLATLMSDPEMRLTMTELAFMIRSHDLDDEPFQLGCTEAEVW